MDHGNMSGIQICRTKRKYDTANQALDFALFQFTTYGDYHSPYKCKHCYKWHLPQKRAEEPTRYFIKKFNKWYGAKIL